MKFMSLKLAPALLAALALSAPVAAEGLDAAAYEKRWNVALNEFQIRSLSEEGLIERDGSRIRATRHGRLLLNTVIARLAP